VNEEDCEEGDFGNIRGESAAGDADEPLPEGGYGWVIVGCLIAMNASTWGEHRVSCLPNVLYGKA
jgi:hypothetical protein